MENIVYDFSSQEAKFELSELFFSITKTDSTIVAANETFMRISGYERGEIIGKPHNIIRHADMPRVVFKTFWDYLNAKKSVAAYVKNRTKEGGFYWVFAVVFPLDESYVSIRIEPNSRMFSSVREIYAKLLQCQESLSMQESQDALLNLLQEAGYRDYDHFMNEALVSELLMRKKLFLEIEAKEDTICTKSVHRAKMEDLYCSSKIVLEKYAEWFEKIDGFIKIKSLFEEKSFMLSSLARDIIFLSLNASVASYRVDTFGETFGVLASDIRINAKENGSLIEQIDLLSHSLSQSLNEIIFLVSSISLQMEMITYFIKELFEDSNGESMQNVSLLFKLVHLYNSKLNDLTHIVDKTIQKSISYLGTLEGQIMYLGYIQIYGIIESARSNDDASGFGEIFSQLKSLISNTADEVLQMKKMAERFSSDIRFLMGELRENEAVLIKLEHEIS
jgi:aerotaxis receptor